jgi:hypothetical protein
MYIYIFKTGETYENFYSLVNLKGASAFDSRSSWRDRHGVVGAYIWLETTPTLFGVRRCESKNHADPQIASGATDGDALRTFREAIVNNRDTS